MLKLKKDKIQIRVYESFNYHHFGVQHQRVYQQPQYHAATIGHPHPSWNPTAQIGQQHFHKMFGISPSRNFAGAFTF